MEARAFDEGQMGKRSGIQAYSFLGQGVQATPGQRGDLSRESGPDCRSIGGHRGGAGSGGEPGEDRQVVVGSRWSRHALEEFLETKLLVDQ